MPDELAIRFIVVNKSEERQQVWQRTSAFLREALRDNEEDFTSGPVGRALGLLAIPMMLEMAMESVFAVVDIAFVSRLGTDAIAAVGITEALVTVLYAMAIGLGIGLTAMVSRRIGAGDPVGAAEVTGQAIWVGALLSIVVGVAGVVCLGYPFHPPGKPERLRTAHLETLKTPTLIVQGTRDRLGTEGEVAIYALSPSIELAWMGDGDHSFKPRKKSGRTLEQNLEAAADAVVALSRRVG